MKFEDAKQIAAKMLGRTIVGMDFGSDDGELGGTLYLKFDDGTDVTIEGYSDWDGDRFLELSEGPPFKQPVVNIPPRPKTAFEKLTSVIVDKSVRHTFESVADNAERM